jgi:hypothetical protein
MTGCTWKVAAAAVAVVCAASGITATLAGADQPAQPAPPAATAPAAAQPAPRASAPVPPKKGAGERTANAAQRARSQNHLKQIVLALHNYESAYGHFPQNITDKKGNPLLSWRVAILPFLEQDALFRQFKFDEPWDGPNNKKLLAKMPELYRVGFEPKGETKTYYQGFAGAGTLFEPGKKLKLAGVLDGTSNTLAVVEAGPPVEWTQPADISYVPKNAVPRLEGPFSNVLIAATADGAVHMFRRDIDDKTLRRLIEIADGEVVELDKLHGKFPLTAEDRGIAKKLLAANEQLMKAIADELKEQQKLVLELAEQNPKGDAGLDLEELGRMNYDLLRGLEELKRRTKSLKQQIEGDKPTATPEKK